MFDTRTPAIETIKRGIIDTLVDKHPNLVFNGGVNRLGEITLADPRAVRKKEGVPNTKINAQIKGYKKNIWYFYDRDKLEDWVNEFSVRSFALRDYSTNELTYVLRMLKIDEEQVDVFRANRYMGQERIRITAKKSSIQFIGTVLIDVTTNSRY
jgi:hypothetical protein